MCTVSNIMDYGLNKWSPMQTWTQTYPVYNGPTKEQFEEFLTLLRAAKKFDDATGQPDCEIEEKKAMIRKMAESLGVDFKDL